MLPQCSARLTLIWLSGSALLLCQPVWTVVKLFERGLEMRGRLFVPSWVGLQGCRSSVCSQTLTSHTPTLTHPLPTSPRLASALFLSPPLFLSLSFTHAETSAYTNTCTHFLLFLSEASLKELWLCGLEEIQTFCHFVGFSPKTTKTQHWEVALSTCGF